MPASTPSAEEITLLRQELTDWMLDTCSIYRTTEVDDAGGGVTQAETLVAAGVPCSLESGAAQEQIELIAGRLLNDQVFTVFLPATQDIQVTDHIVVTSQGNMHIVVQALLAPESLELERRVIATREGRHLA